MLGLTIVGALFAFASLCATGANDVANALGTSVGSKALTVRSAIVLAGIFEFLGASLVGSNVSATLASKVAEPALFAPRIFVAGMFSALVGSFAWVAVATYFALPVSSTHAVIGSLVAFAVAGGHSGSINVTQVLLIAASWVISPTLGAILGGLTNLAIKRAVLQAPDPTERATVVLPLVWGLTLSTVTTFILVGGPPLLRPDLAWQGIALVFAACVAAFAAAAVLWMRGIGPWLKIRARTAPAVEESKPATPTVTEEEQFKEDEESCQANRRSSGSGDAAAIEPGQAENEVVDGETPPVEVATAPGEAQPSTSQRARVERMFVPLMVVSAASIAFAHGGNDVANAIGPFTVILRHAQSGEVGSDEPTPIYVTVLGGLGIVVGLAAYGRRVMTTVGERITKLSFSRGYSAQFGASVSALLATVLGLPVSTTSVLVGGIAGVGLTDRSKVDVKLLGRILAGWMITLPCAGAVTAATFYITRAIVE